MTNHLIHETSPYLLQHAANPVDWYPWGEEALMKARTENKPILLSIGYAACHWCHVMAHESFEDVETAAVMNELFVNIKVDREERPDLDKIYQAAHYLLTQRSGGWPLTVFLTPDDLTPFFSGTYFPVTARYSLPAFKDILRTIAHTYQEKPAEIKLQNAELMKILMQPYPVQKETEMSLQPLQLALISLERHFDREHGGFGGAPKFPQPTKLDFLLQQKNDMAQITLQQIANGGIYDQLAGGFFRYTVDARWNIPHFEKMLYDNAQLLFCYAQAYQQSRLPLFADVARATAEWAIHAMQAPEGGFYSSFDADSQGGEGKFYIWDPAEVERLLNREEYYVVRLYFGLDQPANVEHHWHLHVAEPLQVVASDLGITLPEATTLLATAKSKLLAYRGKRVAPDRDEKILTAWNALMIKALCVAGFVLQEATFVNAAASALQFIRQHAWKQQRLLASYKDGKAHLPAYLDDYAYLLDALLTSLQINWKTADLHFAITLADILLAHFYDPNAGGFYFTANDHEKLLYRPMSMMDEVIPAGNAIAARAMLLLGHLLGESRYLQAAEKTLQTAWLAMSQYPAEHCAMLLALQDYLNPPQMIVIRGETKEMASWVRAVKSAQNAVFALPADEANLPGVLGKTAATGQICAYVCAGTQCSAVIQDLAELQRVVESPTS